MSQFKKILLCSTVSVGFMATGSDGATSEEKDEAAQGVRALVSEALPGGGTTMSSFFVVPSTAVEEEKKTPPVAPWSLFSPSTWWTAPARSSSPTEKVAKVNPQVPGRKEMDTKKNQRRCQKKKRLRGILNQKKVGMIVMLNLSEKFLLLLRAEKKNKKRLRFSPVEIQRVKKIESIEARNKRGALSNILREGCSVALLFEGYNQNK